ncbi:MAG: SusC/RagA family TonB-linked outer membrane protein [Bacteroidales bacterium]|nr:SusC/RagA family TonB-linked outer membrane protein [Bacteroidales bacterium]
MKKLKVFFSVLMVFSATLAYSQNIQVKGKVTDASTGEPLPGAAILIKGTPDGVVADVDGNYTVSVSSKGTLGFTTIGYKDQEIEVNGRAVINVSLEPDVELLEETIVIGYGSARNIANVAGAVTTVKADIVKNAPSSSALDNLQGQVAGMLVLTSTGMVGDNSTSITIHGTGSLGASSTPLYVIDGVPSTSFTMSNINPNDIQNITVLKDAVAISIYGSRAANGVVYITTKSGSFNSKATVTLRSQWGVSTLANEQFYKNFMSGDEWIDFNIRSGIMSAATIEKNFTSKGYTANTEWYKVFQNLNTLQSQNDVTIEGGSDKVAYAISGSQFHQDGSAVGNFLDRYTARTNIVAHPKKWLKVGANVGLSLTKNQGNSSWGTNSVNGGLSYLWNPLYPIIDPETGKEYVNTYPGNISNPRTRKAANPDIYDDLLINGNVFVQVEPIRNLIIKTQVGTDTIYETNDYLSKPSYFANKGVGTRYLEYSLNSNNTITNTIEYSFNIGHNNEFTLLAGHEGIDNFANGFYAQSSGQTDDRTLVLDKGKQETFDLGESLAQSRFNSFFGRLEYNYASKYVLNATIRNDACSRFGANNRNATFWSVGAKWNMIGEDFVKDSDWIDDLNLRVSYGTQGNAGIGDYSSLGLIASSFTYGGASSSSLAQPSNPDLTWEKQAMFMASVEGRFYDMIDLEVSFYNRNTSNMLMDVPFPYTSGFEELTSNVGSLRNTGIDITLGIDIVQTKDAFLRFNTVFNYNKETVTELFQGRQSWVMSNKGVGYNVGSPVSFYYPIYAGIDPEDGMPMWYIPGDDPNVTQMDPEKVTKRFSDSLEQNTGISRHAPISGGFGLHGGWKWFSFAADFSYVLGKYLINNDLYFYRNPANFSGYNCSKICSDFWTPDNRDASCPDWANGGATYFDSLMIEDASFLRLKNLQVGINLPVENWGWRTVKGLKLTLTGRNLLTATNYSGIDPEVNSNLSIGNVGNSKQFLGGIELTF